MHLLILGLCGAVILGLGAAVPARRAGARRPSSRCCWSRGLGLTHAALLTLANLLGADFDHFSPGAWVWTSLVVAALAAWAALRRASAICALIAAAEAGVAVLALWDWLFDPSGPTPFRWLLLVLAIALVLVSLVARGGWPRHAEQLVNAAGLAILAIGLTGVAGAVVESFSPFGGEPDGAAARELGGRAGVRPAAG